MNPTKHIAVAAAIVTSVALTHASAWQADAPSPATTIAPMQGATLDVGNERAVTYFLNDGGRCRLVVTLTAEPAPDAHSFTATRFEATIEGGEATRFVSDGGGVFDFDCAPSAHTVSIRAAEPAGALAVR